MAPLKPMLASKLDFAKLRYPVFVSPKIDGVRCVVRNSVAYSRTGKELPNRYLQMLVFDAAQQLDLCDGEVVVGSPSAANVYNATLSGVMSRYGTPKVRYLIFDYLGDMRAPYTDRLHILQEAHEKEKFPPWCSVLPQVLCHDRASVERMEAKCIKFGYEGCIVRGRKSPYKQGRSTVNEGYLLKLKRFEDNEAEVVGFTELHKNANEAFKDELGHTKRSSHKANQIPMNTLGALRVVLLSNRTVEFQIGSGFDHAQRAYIWAHQDEHLGKVVKFKSQPHGKLDAPRFPIFLGWRSPIDL